MTEKMIKVMIAQGNFFLITEPPNSASTNQEYCVQLQNSADTEQHQNIFLHLLSCYKYSLVSCIVSMQSGSFGSYKSQWLAHRWSIS